MNELRRHMPRIAAQPGHALVGSERRGVDGERWLCTCGQSFTTYAALRAHGLADDLQEAA